MQPGPSYEERYRWTPTVGWSLLGCIAFVLIGILSSMPLALLVPIIGFCAWGTGNIITYAASRKVALRVDHAGVTLGGSPFRYKTTTRFFPWADIEKIILRRRMFPVTIGRWTLFSFGPLRYITLQRRRGAPPLSPGRTTRALSAWRLDENQLAAAVTACAPTVQLVRSPTEV
jgi:hypothetical protein